MHFYVEGTENKGTVHVHMTKAPGEKELRYRVLSLNVGGKEVVYLENREEIGVKGKVSKMFGVQWR